VERIRAQRLIDTTPATSGSSSNNPVNTSEAPIHIIQAMNPQPVAMIADISQNLIQEAGSFANQFESYIVLNSNESSISEFDKLFAKFSTFLFEANDRLPGPQNPAVVFYRKHKQGHRNIMDRKCTESSNPQRATKRQAQRTKYNYEITTWHNGNTPTKGGRWQTAF